MDDPALNFAGFQVANFLLPVGVVTVPDGVRNTAIRAVVIWETDAAVGGLCEVGTLGEAL